jgi:hypothetical protein
VDTNAWTVAFSTSVIENTVLDHFFVHIYMIVGSYCVRHTSTLTSESLNMINPKNALVYGVISILLVVMAVTIPPLLDLLAILVSL